MRNHLPIRSSLARFPAPIAVAIAIALLASTAASAGDQAASTGNPASSAGNPAASTANAAPLSGNVVYKWKDSHGISQYSQQPPPKGVKFDIIENSGASSDNPQATDPNNTKN